MPDRKYICTVTHFTGSTYYKAGIVYLFPSDPGANFTATNQDPLEFDAARVHQDMDGTIYFPGNRANYDDFRFSLSQSKQGANLKPDYDFNNNGFLFPQNDAGEVLYLSQIASHRMKVGPGVVWYPHIHFVQSGENLPTFEYRYRIGAPGAAVPAFSDWIASGPAIFPYTSGSINQIVTFPAVNTYAAGLTDIACLVDVQLRRNDDVVAGDVLAKEFDFHAPFDSPLGSGQEFIK